MCGICGFSGEGDIALVADMAARLAHRGPDAQGTWSAPDRGIYLGHRRLSIIDLVSGGQPMTTEDGNLTVTFNGEIYNHSELRRSLQDHGHRFVSSHSDTEVLLHGWREWGEDLPARLNGMWAFALFDRSRNLLFLSRDRFGKKPLYYSASSKAFVFASELKALLVHPEVEGVVSVESLQKYFAYGFIPGPRSIYQGVFKLPGGHSLVLDLADHSFRVKPYWKYVIEPFETRPQNPEEEWGGRLLELLEKAVARRLMSDVPLGVFLSGGIDSSAITGLASRTLGPDRLRTFSIGFVEPSFDESSFARRSAELFKTRHVMEILSMERARDLLPEIVAGLDEPLGDSSILPTYLLCQETRKHVTVALGGDGGDELFAGYDPFKALKWAEIYQKLVPRPVHQAIRLVTARLPVSHRNMSLDFRLKRTLRGLSYPPAIRNAVWLGPLEPLELAMLFGRPVDLEEVYSEAIEAWEACGPENLVDKTLQFYANLYLIDDILVKTDRASMMNSLEVRAPFLDADLVDFVRQVPHEFKFRQGKTKYLLKAALGNLLPDEIIHRPKKGFGVPVGQWFQEKALTWTPPRDWTPMSSFFLAQKKQEHELGKADHRAFLWNAWLLERAGFWPPGKPKCEFY